LDYDVTLKELYVILLHNIFYFDQWFFSFVAKEDALRKCSFLHSCNKKCIISNNSSYVCLQETFVLTAPTSLLGYCCCYVIPEELGVRPLVHRQLP